MPDKTLISRSVDLPHPPESTSKASVEEEPPRKRRRKAPWVVAGLVIAGIATATWISHRQPSQETGRGGHGMGGAPAPIVPGQAKSGDFPLYLDGLGTVQAYNSVTVRARVDGEIQQIDFQEGQDVKQGDVLVQIDPRPYQAQLQQAQAKKAQDAAQLANAQLVLERDAELIKNRVIDQQTYDTQRYSVTQLQALVAADDAAIYNAQTQLDYTRIVAPISGRIGLRLIDVGNMIHSSDSNGILVINQVQPISVVFTLPQQDLGAVRKAQQGGKPLTVLALDRDNLSTLATGVLEVVDNQIDAATATVKLKAKFANTDDALWPGQFVNVRLQLGVESGAISVPDAAVQRGPNGSYVYVIGADHTVSMRTIATGASESGSTLVTSGLKAGERIVVDGQYRLQPGAKVTETGPTSASPAAQ